MSSTKRDKESSWFKDWEIDHGIPKDIADLYEMALCLYDDVPIGQEDSHRLAAWIIDIFKKSSKSEEKSEDLSYENVNHPSHYTNGSIECIDAIESSMSQEEFEGYLKGNVIKYLWRYQNKHAPLEDLKKAQWYLNRLIEHS